MILNPVLYRPPVVLGDAERNATCQRCGGEFSTRSRVKRYCDGCVPERRVERTNQANQRQKDRRSLRKQIAEALPCRLCEPQEGLWRVEPGGGMVRCVCQRGRLLAAADKRWRPRG